MKKFIMITLSTTIAILFAEYMFKCLDLGKFAQYMDITIKQVGIISIFVGMIYFSIKFSNKGNLISYFLPMMVYYIIDVTILDLNAFSTIIVTISTPVFIILLGIGLSIICIYLYTLIMKSKQIEV